MHKNTNVAEIIYASVALKRLILKERRRTHQPLEGNRYQSYFAIN